jgi:hypothetical protein
VAFLTAPPIDVSGNPRPTLTSGLTGVPIVVKFHKRRETMSLGLILVIILIIFLLGGFSGRFGGYGYGFGHGGMGVLGVVVVILVILLLLGRI